MYSGQAGPGGEPPLGQPWYGIGFVAAIKRFFTKYADFSGRASRGEFWWAFLFLFLAGGAISLLTMPMGSAGTYIGYVWDLAILIPNLAVTVRRLHDTNLSGCWVLLPFGLTYGGAGIVLATVASVDTSALMSEDATIFTPSMVMNMGWALMAVLAGGIVWLVLTVRASNPAGTRFDKGGQPR
ncbi:DUF805 domain-containing protein [Bifidobacterium xylocopae]|nr:DUF805 domain-containing protein [Bifidobacterium xylocopae]